MINKKHFLSIGQFTLLTSILLNQIVKDTPAVSFFVGMCIGLSIVFNIAYLITVRIKRKSI